MTDEDTDLTTPFDTDARHTPPHPPDAEAQFAPGTIVAGRFRIASILGSGGMGEVYRADDTKLRQQVALKFLRPQLPQHAELLRRLHDEVRLGRQIAHPNVCRIFDIVEWEGSHFVAMEYVDGEDLERLLIRIGRLSPDKAVDIGRDIAAGLSAAHGKGILHRDLKPANVMIDSHGHARIMDFGLALNVQAGQPVLDAGTPAYMAPELFTGQSATVQSDLYALGLVIYELLTGRRALGTRTVPNRVQPPAAEVQPPSSFVRDLDPALEHIILRCLDKDPAQRPRSAREVIASLPGGDQLAAALAAGETPSPRIIAAAGVEGSLSRPAAWTMLGAVALFSLLFFFARRALEISSFMSFDRTPEVLRQSAADTLDKLGIPFSGQPIAEFQTRPEYQAWLRQHDAWDAIQRGPSPVLFRVAYGMSPEQWRAATLTSTAAGRATLSLDPRGRLVYLLAPPAGDVATRALDWKPLLDAAGLDQTKLQSTTPRDAPPAPFDVGAAWRGTYPDDKTPIRVEAAAWHGRPVFFRVTGGWDEAADPWKGVAAATRAADLYLSLLVVIVVGAALVLAWRSIRLHRGDRQGAFRLALAYFLVQGAASLLMMHYPRSLLPLIDELWFALGTALLSASVVYVLYVALEPYARRKWPEHLIAWARLLSGRINDPLVGRDVLIGILSGVAYAMLWAVAPIIASTFGWMKVQPYGPLVPAMNGMRFSLGFTFYTAILGITFASMAILILVLSTIAFRKRLIACAVFFVVNLAYFLLATNGQLALVPTYTLVACMLCFIAFRFGLLAYALMQMTFIVMFYGIATAPAWLLLNSAIPFAILAALALWAFRTSLGGQPLLGRALLEE